MRGLKASPVIPVTPDFSYPPYEAIANSQSEWISCLSCARRHSWSWRVSRFGSHRSSLGSSYGSCWRVWRFLGWCLAAT